MKDRSKSTFSHTALSASAIFGALAAVMAILPLSFPFPLLPYQKFDFAELPVMVAFFIFGPGPGLVSSVVYWMVLNFVGSFVPIGPAAKFGAVVTMILGMWLGARIYRKVNMRTGIAGFFALTISLGMILRIIAMSVMNFIILWLLFPSFLDLASTSLNVSMGLTFSAPIDALIAALLVTALFNALHIFLSVIPSYLIVKSTASTGVLLRFQGSWINRAVNNQPTDDELSRR